MSQMLLAARCRCNHRFMGDLVRAPCSAKPLSDAESTGRRELPSLAIRRALSFMLQRPVSGRRRCALYLQKRIDGRVNHIDIDIHLLKFG